MRRAVYTGLVLVLSGGAVMNVLQELQRPPVAGPGDRSFQQVVAWLRQHASARDLTISWKPRVVALYTGLPSSYYIFSEDPERFRQFVRRIGGKWIITYRPAEGDQRWLRSHIEREPDRYPLAFENEEFRIYRITNAVSKR